MTADALSWADLTADAPMLADTVEQRFAATKHHVIATLRADGSPRLSGTEVQFVDGRLAVGLMGGSVKALDLRRDPRCALHTNPGDGSLAEADVKISAVATEVTGDADPGWFEHYVRSIAPPEPFHVFVLEVRDLTTTALHPDGDRMVLTTWRAGRGVHVIERS